MDRTKMAQKQLTLAQVARDDPDHRFHNLYSLLHWDYWIRSAADAVLARPGSDTAGVDHITRHRFKAHYDDELHMLITSLKRKTYLPQPARRTYLPKPNGKLRPLGILALRDRIVQEAIRAILDPIYESDFLPHSYGFRKGRSTMDAVGFMMPLFNRQNKYYYVIEGDLESYFDTIHHRKLLSLLKRRIADNDLLNLIWKFLKAGVMDGGLFARTTTGVPQGGNLSPLLANIYLHEFDRWAAAKWHRSRNELAQRRRTGHGNYKLIRFADDFVVLSNAGIADVRQAKAEIKQFLETELHLKLSDEKTCITHVNQGFTFLGFHIQRVRPEGRWVVHLRPPTKAKERVKAKIKALTSRRWTWLDEYTRLTTLNVIVRGWANYYRYTSLLRDIEDITRYVWLRYLRWLRHKHPGSRVGRLIHTKSRLIHHRTRWTATLREGQQTLHAYQWLPTREEFHRRRYLRKAVAAFPQPYLGASGAGEVDYATGTTGPDEHIYILAIGATDSQSSRHEPLTMAELRLRAKLRDGFRCQRCGRRSDLEVHHTKGTKTHHLTTLATLCRACHVAEHHHDQQEQPDGKPDEVKASHPVWREGRRRPFSES